LGATYSSVGIDNLGPTIVDDVKNTLLQLDATFSERDFGAGNENAVQRVYRRKFTADFAAEANRSVAWWLERWMARP